MHDRYAEYKDSGVEWIGEIPVHWDFLRMKNVFTFGKGLNITKADLVDEGIPVVSYGQIHSKNNTGVHISKDLIRYVDESYLDSGKRSLVFVGDILFADTSEDYNGVGNCLFVDYKGNIFAGYHTLIARSINLKVPKYMAYLFQDEGWRKQVRSEVMGIKVFSLTQRILKNVQILIPPEDERKKIIIYLDTELCQVDSLIAGNENQLSMLTRYKRDLIVECVTKGLDKSAPMRPSGEKWIGDVPEHWKIQPLFSVATENKEKNIGLVCDNLLSLSYGNIIRKDINSNYGLLPASFEGYQVVQEGYTVLRLTDLQNDQRSLRTGYAEEKGIITSAYLALIPSNEMDNKYFRYLLHAYDLIKVFYGLGSGLRQTLNFRDLKHLPLLIPPVEEQERIAAYLDEKIRQIDAIVDGITSQIKKLKDYRRILIHDAVTGKIKI